MEFIIYCGERVYYKNSNIMSGSEKCYVDKYYKGRS